MLTTSLRLLSDYDRRLTAARERLSSPGWRRSTPTCEVRSPGRSSVQTPTSVSGSGRRYGSFGTCGVTWVKHLHGSSACSHCPVSHHRGPGRTHSTGLDGSPNTEGNTR